MLIPTNIKTDLPMLCVNLRCQKMNFFINDFFSKCNQIRNCGFGHILKKSLMENFVFCAVHLGNRTFGISEKSFDDDNVFMFGWINNLQANLTHHLLYSTHTLQHFCSVFKRILEIAEIKRNIVLKMLTYFLWDH